MNEDKYSLTIIAVNVQYFTVLYRPQICRKQTLIIDFYAGKFGLTGKPDVQISQTNHYEKHHFIIFCRFDIINAELCAASARIGCKFARQSKA